MDLKWHGNTCFELKNKKTVLLINPEKDTDKADVILLTESKDIEARDEQKIIDWPGEYEIKGIHIKGFQAWTKSKSKEEAEGQSGNETIIYYFDLGGIKCCHLGYLGHILTSDMVNEIGDVDLLMIDVGEKSNLSPKKAVEIIEAIEPRGVIPMGEGDLSKSLKEIGADNIEEIEQYSISQVSELPEDKRIFIVLKKS